jgi:ribosome-associated translation inhibitor RaiA
MLAIEKGADNIFDIQFEDVNEGKILQSIKQAFKKIKSKAIKMKHKRSNKLKAAAKKSGVKK